MDIGIHEKEHFYGQQLDLSEYPFHQDFPDFFVEGGTLNHCDERCLLKYGKGFCVDLGTSCGRSAIILSKNADRVITIDWFIEQKDLPNYNYEKVKEKLSKYNKIELINGNIDEYAKNYNNIDTLFIDGSHEYEDIKLNFNNWFKKVKFGGYILLHDCIEIYPGVKQFCDELKNEEFLDYYGMWGWIAVFKKI